MITYIAFLEYCEARHVHVYANASRLCASQMDYAPWQNLPIIDAAELQCSDEVDGQRLYDCRITAMMPNRVVLPEDPLVFRLKDVYGYTYLFGVPQFAPPYPLVTQQDHVAAKPSDSSLCKLDIRLKSAYPILKFI